MTQEAAAAEPVAVLASDFDDEPEPAESEGLDPDELELPESEEAATFVSDLSDLSDLSALSAFSDFFAAARLSVL